MNRIRPIRHLAAALAGLAAALAAALLASGVTPAFASIPADEGGPADLTVPVPPPAVQVHTVAGGMPGWQITLIAIGAALFAATAAVLLERARATRRHPATAGA